MTYDLAIPKTALQLQEEEAPKLDFFVAFGGLLENMLLSLGVLTF